MSSPRAEDDVPWHRGLTAPLTPQQVEDVLLDGRLSWKQRLQRIPEAQRSEAVYARALAAYPVNVSLLPLPMLEALLPEVRAALAAAPACLRTLPAAFLAAHIEDVVAPALAQQGTLIQYVPESILEAAPHLLQLAVEDMPLALHLIPRRWRSAALCHAALRKSMAVLPAVPEAVRADAMKGIPPERLATTAAGIAYLSPLAQGEQVANLALTLHREPAAVASVDARVLRSNPCLLESALFEDARRPDGRGGVTRETLLRAAIVPMVPAAAWTMAVARRVLGKESRALFDLPPTLLHGEEEASRQLWVATMSYLPSEWQEGAWPALPTVETLVAVLPAFARVTAASLIMPASFFLRDLRALQHIAFHNAAFRGAVSRSQAPGAAQRHPAVVWERLVLLRRLLHVDEAGRGLGVDHEAAALDVMAAVRTFYATHAWHHGIPCGAAPHSLKGADPDAGRHAETASTRGLQQLEAMQPWFLLPLEQRRVALQWHLQQELQAWLAARREGAAASNAEEDPCRASGADALLWELLEDADVPLTEEQACSIVARAPAAFPSLPAPLQQRLAVCTSALTTTMAALQFVPRELHHAAVGAAEATPEALAQRLVKEEAAGRLSGVGTPGGGGNSGVGEASSWRQLLRLLHDHGFATQRTVAGTLLRTESAAVEEEEDKEQEQQVGDGQAQGQDKKEAAASPLLGRWAEAADCGACLPHLPQALYPWLLAPLARQLLRDADATLPLLDVSMVQRFPLLLAAAMASARVNNYGITMAWLHELSAETITSTLGGAKVVYAIQDCLAAAWSSGAPRLPFALFRAEDWARYFACYRHSLATVPLAFRSATVCLQAVASNPEEIREVPADIMSLAIVDAAVASWWSHATGTALLVRHAGPMQVQAQDAKEDDAFTQDAGLAGHGLVNVDPPSSAANSVGTTSTMTSMPLHPARSAPLRRAFAAAAVARRRAVTAAIGDAAFAAMHSNHREAVMMEWLGAWQAQRQAYWERSVAAAAAGDEGAEAGELLFDDTGEWSSDSDSDDDSRDEEWDCSADGWQARRMQQHGPRHAACARDVFLEDEAVPQEAVAAAVLEGGLAADYGVLETTLPRHLLVREQQAALLPRAYGTMLRRVFSRAAWAALAAKENGGDGQEAVSLPPHAASLAAALACLPAAVAQHPGFTAPLARHRQRAADGALPKEAAVVSGNPDREWESCSDASVDSEASVQSWSASL